MLRVRSTWRIDGHDVAPLDFGRPLHLGDMLRVKSTLQRGESFLVSGRVQFWLRPLPHLIFGADQCDENVRVAKLRIARQVLLDPRLLVGGQAEFQFQVNQLDQQRIVIDIRSGGAASRRCRAGILAARRLRTTARGGPVRTRSTWGLVDWGSLVVDVIAAEMKKLLPLELGHLRTLSGIRQRARRTDLDSMSAPPFR